MSLTEPVIADLESALADLESCVETPVVPGELTEWSGRLRTAFEAVLDLYVETARPSHQRQIAEIRREDQEMGAVTEQLAQMDESLFVELVRLRSLVGAYVDQVDPRAEGSDEHASEEERQSLVSAVLSVVIQMRTLERSLQTWFVEAFQRDRGVAD